jgi:hypothetical protein
LVGAMAKQDLRNCTSGENTQKTAKGKMCRRSAWIWLVFLPLLIVTL